MSEDELNEESAGLEKDESGPGELLAVIGEEVAELPAEDESLGLGGTKMGAGTEEVVGEAGRGTFEELGIGDCKEVM